jgi:hypothetical protein
MIDLVKNHMREAIRLKRRAAKATADGFIRAAATNNPELFVTALEALDKCQADARKQIARQDCDVHPEFLSQGFACQPV